MTYDASKSPAAFPVRPSSSSLQPDRAAAIAVVDPDEQARAAAVRLCEDEGYRVLPFAGGDEFLRAGPPAQLTCVLLDISTPDRDGIEVLRRLAEGGAAPPVIVLTGRADIGRVVETMRLRSIDLIEKPCQPESLLGAIGRAQILAGDIGSAWQTRREAAELVERLTRRRQQGLQGVACGEPGNSLARKLGLGLRTLLSCRARVMARLRARNVADAVRIAIAAGIIGGALYVFGNR